MLLDAQSDRAAFDARPGAQAIERPAVAEQIGEPLQPAGVHFEVLIRDHAIAKRQPEAELRRTQPPSSGMSPAITVSGKLAMPPPLPPTTPPRATRLRRASWNRDVCPGYFAAYRDGSHA